MQASDVAKSFFYFTKESHIYTLLNCILEGGIETKIKRSAIPELDYLSQICFELYESETTAKSLSAESESSTPEQTFAYSIRITISPGCHTYDPLDVQLDSKHCIGCAPRRSLTLHADWKQVIETLRAKFHQVKLPKSFLAINLSESHTFHKKEGTPFVGEATFDEMKANGEVDVKDSGNERNHIQPHLNDSEVKQMDTPNGTKITAEAISEWNQTTPSMAEAIADSQRTPDIAQAAKMQE